MRSPWFSMCSLHSCSKPKELMRYASCEICLPAYHGGTVFLYTLFFGSFFFINLLNTVPHKFRHYIVRYFCRRFWSSSHHDERSKTKEEEDSLAKQRIGCILEPPVNALIIGKPASCSFLCLIINVYGPVLFCEDLTGRRTTCCRIMPLTPRLIPTTTD